MEYPTYMYTVYVHIAGCHSLIVFRSAVDDWSMFIVLEVKVNKHKSDVCDIFTATQDSAYRVFVDMTSQQSKWVQQGGPLSASISYK